MSAANLSEQTLLLVGAIFILYFVIFGIYLLVDKYLCTGKTTTKRWSEPTVIVPEVAEYVGKNGYNKNGCTLSEFWDLLWSIDAPKLTFLYHGVGKKWKKPSFEIDMDKCILRFKPCALWAFIKALQNYLFVFFSNFSPNV